MSTRTRFVVLSAALAALAASPAYAQLGGLKNKIKERVEQKTDRAAERALDRAERAVNCAVDDADCVAQARKEGKEVQLTDANGNPVKPEAGSPAASPARSLVQAPGQGAWANYDFVPGERVLFAEDFSQDRVGNFPRRLHFETGNMEVVESQGKRWLRLAGSDEGVFSITLPEALPQRFTMEFDMTIPTNWCSGVYFGEADAKATSNAGANCDAPGGYIRVLPNGFVGLGRGGDYVSQRKIEDLLGDRDSRSGIDGLPFHVRLQVDGDYAKLYVGETRVANVPSIKIARTDRIFFRLQGGREDRPLMVAGISVNAGGRGLYDALAADGRVATQGIFFDTGSDRIRPESTPTLKEITAMLNEHADLKLVIEGHTDNVGQAPMNLALSEKRAAAVRAYLVQQGIAEARLQSKGMGDTKPAAKNDTPEGRQQNRRVELVKM